MEKISRKMTRMVVVVFIGCCAGFLEIFLIPKSMPIGILAIVLTFFGILFFTIFSSFCIIGEINEEIGRKVSEAEDNASAKGYNNGAEEATKILTKRYENLLEEKEKEAFEKGYATGCVEVRMPLLSRIDWTKVPIKGETRFFSGVCVRMNGSSIEEVKFVPIAEIKDKKEYET